MQKLRKVDQYQLMEVIGKGANGLVYKGLDTTNGSLVAVKQLFIGKSQVKGIKTQLELLKQLDHPSIVKFIDAIQKDNRIYLVLEYMQGGALGALVRKSPLDEDVAKIYVKQILQGLIFLHKREVIHRDIKGANLLLTKTGSIKLADFGVAVKLEDNQKTISAAGSPYWMAPQNISSSGEQPSVKCDIWSLGCTLVEILTGNPPYYDLMQFPALFRIVEDEHPPLPQCSEQCRDFLLACFVKDPKKRPSAQELIAHPWLRNTNQLKPLASESENEAVDLIGRFLRPVIDYPQLLKLLKSTNQSKLVYRSKYFHAVVADNRTNNCHRIRLIVALIQCDEQSLPPLYKTGILAQQVAKIMTKPQLSEEYYRSYGNFVQLAIKIYCKAVSQDQIHPNPAQSTQLLLAIVQQTCLPVLGRLLSFFAKQGQKLSKVQLLKDLSCYLLTLATVDKDQQMQYKVRITDELQQTGALKTILTINSGTQDEEILGEAKLQIITRLAQSFGLLLEMKPLFRKYVVYAIAQLLRNGFCEHPQLKFMCLTTMSSLQTAKAEMEKNGIIYHLATYYGGVAHHTDNLSVPQFNQSLLLLQQLLTTSRGKVEQNRVLQLHRHQGIAHLKSIAQHIKQDNNLVMGACVRNLLFQLISIPLNSAQ